MSHTPQASHQSPLPTGPAPLLAPTKPPLYLAATPRRYITQLPSTLAAHSSTASLHLTAQLNQSPSQSALHFTVLRSLVPSQHRSTSQLAARSFILLLHLIPHCLSLQLADLFSQPQQSSPPHSGSSGQFLLLITVGTDEPLLATGRKEGTRIVCDSSWYRRSEILEPACWLHFAAVPI